MSEHRREISLEEAERLFPNSTVEWDQLLHDVGIQERWCALPDQAKVYRVFLFSPQGGPQYLSFEEDDPDDDWLLPPRWIRGHRGTWNSPFALPKLLCP